MEPSRTEAPRPGPGAVQATARPHHPSASPAPSRPWGNPFEDVVVEAWCTPVISYAHAVVGRGLSMTVRVSAPAAQDTGGTPSTPPSDRSTVPGRPRGATGLNRSHPATPPGRPLGSRLPRTVAVTLRIRHEQGYELTEPWHLTWDTASHPVLKATRRLPLNRAGLLRVTREGRARIQVTLDARPQASAQPRPGAGPAPSATRAQATRYSVTRLPGALTVLPPRRWILAGDTTWAGDALATFVQPTQSAVRTLAAEVLGRLRPGSPASPPRANTPRATTPSPSGPGSPEEADALVYAVLAALHRRGLRATQPPAPWDRVALPIRPGASLLDLRRGSTLELAVLIASVLEHLEVPALLLLTPTHVLVGYQRQAGAVAASSPEAVIDLVKRGVVELIDPALLAFNDLAPSQEGPRTVLTPADLALTVSIGAARAGRILPQPDPGHQDPTTQVPAPTSTPTPVPARPGAAPADQPTGPSPTGPAPSPSGPGPASPGGSGPANTSPTGPGPDGTTATGPVPQRVEEWKQSLLDLSTYNPLIHIPSYNNNIPSAGNMPKDVVELLMPGHLVSQLEDRVNAKDLIALVPADSDVRQGTPQADALATTLLTEHRTVQVNLATRHYQPVLASLTDRSQSSMSETGASNLYLAIGTLRWQTSEKQVRSPLILIPVTLGLTEEGYVLTPDETVVSTPNHSLVTRFKADTGIELTELVNPQRDRHGIDVDATMKAIRLRLHQAHKDKEVTLAPTVHLGLFRFSPYRMWQDLEDSWRTLAANPLVSHLIEAPGHDFVDPAGVPASEPGLDAVVEDLPLTADATQARVVAEAVTGHSLVVEGPPGTGKSQTVANLVFRALATGKTIMFVAEKQSALDVVARRLRQETGIGPLLLNLHDNSVRSAEVRDTLRTAYSLDPGTVDAARLAADRERLRALRSQLERYRTALHRPNGSVRSYYDARARLVAPRADGPQDETLRLFKELSHRTGLDSFDPAAHRDLVEDYRQAQARVRAALSQEALAAVARRRDKVLAEAGRRAQELRQEILHRKGMSIQELMGAYGDLVTALTPCILASPDSVAHFLPARRRYVDIVVFDEASQIRVAAAVGAIGRGRSAVIVGDPRQMPPTATARPRGAAGGEVADETSVLTRCLDGGVASYRLGWHYRSRVESLIAFSNQRYYDGTLASFPSPLAMAARPDDSPDGYGISLRRVQGTYISPEERHHHPQARPRTNPREAREIVNEVLLRLRASECTPSLGVITFNAAQRDLIERFLREGPDADRVARALEEPDGLFVKNLENVQGEERDTILFSVTFSADSSGRVPLSLGPLSQAGGERRLNVAVTRARRQVLVFSSFDPEDLHAERSRHQGLKDLRAYLELARDGGVPPCLSSPAFALPVDWHRHEIAEALRSRGLTVHVGVGHSSFAVDLVLARPDQPDRPRVAVLLDGHEWNQRGTVTDRDLLPVDVLRQMGWERVERIWMPEWVRDSRAVTDRLLAAVGWDGGAGAGRATRPGADTGNAGPGAAAGAGDATRADTTGAAPAAPPAGAGSAVGTTPATTGPDALGPASAHAAPAGRVPEYVAWRRTQVRPRKVLDRAEAGPGQDPQARAEVIRVAKEICAVESPLRYPRLVRKVCWAFDLSPVFASRERKVRRILGSAFAYVDEEDFVWASMDSVRTAPPWRRNALDHVERIEDIHPRELVALMAQVRSASPAWISKDDLFLEVLKRLSTKKRRITPSRREHLENILILLQNDEMGTRSIV
ncbi:DUF4011 domain-containing protein [Actinomyces sp. oral taxon 897]|uniref:DUF4011 domain-containing protein n=1 Tax=Actinomyces sp. oral taxon 897 TaxID=2081702 RepID=UPI000D0277A7|nr:DUF4011 domain-containing protein [Actinomyces sp. oral taxon 897]AVM61991.1 hypothetical protein C3V41_07895 [Actinomyces sp. oral taxon 897]